jgi:hypothetical protein
VEWTICDHLYRLLFSALTYERSKEGKREGIRRCSSMDWSQLRAKPLLPNHKHDLFSGRSVDNAAQTTSLESSHLPRHATIYGTFPTEFTIWQQDYASRSPDSTYVQPTSRPGSASSYPYRKEDSDVIYKAMQRWGFEYEPVSELDSDGSAYTAAFWDKDSNWVVVAFKGTPDRDL